MARRKRPVVPRREDNSVYSDLLLMTVPLLVLSVYLYGLRCAALYAAAVVVANLCDRVVALLRSRPFEAQEYSNEAFAAMLAVMLPATVDYYVLIVAVLAAVMVGKEAFGGYGSYVFHPTCVGYAVAAISWPEQVGRYPAPFSVLPIWGSASASLTEPVLNNLKYGGLPGVPLANLLIGYYAGPMGATAVLILLAAALFLHVRRRIPVAAMSGFLITCAVIMWVLPQAGEIPLSAPWQFLSARLEVFRFEIVSSFIPFAAVFLLCDPYTIPKKRSSRFVFGVLLGLGTTLFQYFGSLEAGACFSMLMCNSISGWIDRMASLYFPAANRKGALR